MRLTKNNFSKPKRHWDMVESLIDGDKKRMIEDMAVKGSIVAVLGEEQVVYEVEDKNEKES